MQQAVDLLPQPGIGEQGCPQARPVDGAIRALVAGPKCGMQRLPARLSLVQKTAAAVVHIDKRRQTITGQQAADAALAGADAAGDAQNHGALPRPRNAASTACISGQSGAVAVISWPLTGWVKVRLLACSICRSGRTGALAATLPP